MLNVKREFVNRSLHEPGVALPKVHVRGPFDHDGPEFDLGVDCQYAMLDDGEVVATPSLTRQSDADDCDINVMMAKYQATGEPPRTNPREPQWGDFTSVPDYQESLRIVQEAKDEFEALPAEVRAKFGNDPSGMLAFLSDEANRDEAIKLGLVVPPVPEAPPTKVEIVNPPERKGKKGSAEPVDGD